MKKTLLIVLAAVVLAMVVFAASLLAINALKPKPPFTLRGSVTLSSGGDKDCSTYDDGSQNAWFNIFECKSSEEADWHEKENFKGASDGSNSDPSYCHGQSGYDDLVEGSPVTITDSKGEVIALGELQPGVYNPDIESCIFEFSVSVPAGKGFYGVSVSHRGTSQVSEVDARRYVSLSLGN